MLLHFKEHKKACSSKVRHCILVLRSKPLYSFMNLRLSLDLVFSFFFSHPVIFSGSCALFFLSIKSFDADNLSNPMQVRLTFSGRGPTLHLPPPYSIVIQVVSLNLYKVYIPLMTNHALMKLNGQPMLLSSLDVGI